MNINEYHKKYSYIESREVKAQQLRDDPELMAAIIRSLRDQLIMRIKANDDDPALYQPTATVTDERDGVVTVIVYVEKFTVHDADGGIRAIWR